MSLRDLADADRPLDAMIELALQRVGCRGVARFRQNVCVAA